MQQRQQLVDGGVKRAGNAASQGPPGKMIVFFIVFFTLATDQYLHPGLANSCGGGFQLASADGEHNAQALAGEF